MMIYPLPRHPAIGVADEEILYKSVVDTFNITFDPR